jgi:hypothetical protein
MLLEGKVVTMLSKGSGARGLRGATRVYRGLMALCCSEGIEEVRDDKHAKHVAERCIHETQEICSQH